MGWGSFLFSPFPFSPPYSLGSLVTGFSLRTVIIFFIIHQTHYQKSDWSRAFNQFTIAYELDMISAISAADIAFIMVGCLSLAGHDLNNESFTTRLPVTPADSSCCQLETSEVYWTFFLVTGDGVEMLTCTSNF